LRTSTTRLERRRPGTYPSKSTGEKGAWFKDSEGNLLGIVQPVR
jgi:hypothetical protein